MQLNPFRALKTGRALRKSKKVIRQGERAARSGAETLQSKVSESAETAKQAGRDVVNKAGDAGKKLKEGAGKLREEVEISRTLHAEVHAALRRMQEEDSRLESELAQAYGYAVFPAVATAAAVFGFSYGRGEVFEHGKVVGYAGVVQLTLGTQLGGQAFDQIVVFDDREALERFQAGKVSFAAGASTALVKAGALAHRAPPATRAFYYSTGGFMVGAAIGAQKFVYRPAVLGRWKDAEEG
jgi:lipid-binding SYLF domain-containing protein